MICLNFISSQESITGTDKMSTRKSKFYFSVVSHRLRPSSDMVACCFLRHLLCILIKQQIWAAPTHLENLFSGNATKILWWCCKALLVSESGFGSWSEVLKGICPSFSEWFGDLDLWDSHERRKQPSLMNLNTSYFRGIHDQFRFNF